MSLIRNRGCTNSSSSARVQLKNLSGNSPEPFAEHLTYLEQNQMDKITSSEICEGKNEHTEELN